MGRRTARKPEPLSFRGAMLSEGPAKSDAVTLLLDAGSGLSNKPTVGPTGFGVANDALTLRISNHRPNATIIA